MGAFGDPYADFPRRAIAELVGGETILSERYNAWKVVREVSKLVNGRGYDVAYDDGSTEIIREQAETIVRPA